MPTMNALIGAIAGAGLMYVLDPASGAHRRALACDQVDHARRQVTDGTGTILRDAQDRGRGLWTALVSELAPDDVPNHQRWSPSVRAGGVAFGGGLVLDGIRRGGLRGVALGFAGMVVLFRALTNEPLADRIAGRDRLGRPGGEPARPRTSEPAALSW